MAISSYFDEKKQKIIFKVRVVKKSNSKVPIVICKKANGIETIAEAKKIEKKIINEAIRELVAKENRSIMWNELVSDWELSAKKGDIFIKELNHNTIMDYVHVILKYAPEWKNYCVDEIDKASAWRVLDKVEREVSIDRRKRVRTAIDAVFSWGILSGRISKSVSLPTEGYKSNLKQVDKIPEILNIKEIKFLLAYAKKIEHKWYPIWVLALMTGMRNGELYALEWKSVNFENREIQVYLNWNNRIGFGPTKGRYWRTVPMSKELYGFLLELKLIRGNEKSVLPRFNSWTKGLQAEVLRNFCVGSGITSVKFHTLRACFATQLIRDGVAPAVIMKIAGWKDLKTMQRYIRLAGIEVKGATDGLKLLTDEECIETHAKIIGGLG